jgi:hypothetical protein
MEALTKGFHAWRQRIFNILGSYVFTLLRVYTRCQPAGGDGYWKMITLIGSGKVGPEFESRGPWLHTAYKRNKDTDT